MRTVKEWEQDIINITLKIHQEFPELSKYIKEMPVKISERNNEAMNNKNLEDYYNSLKNLIGKYSKTHEGIEVKKDIENLKFSGYPTYPASEDIYNREKKESDLNPEDITKTKTPNEKVGTKNEKDFKNAMSGDDLDVPGSELDDQQENIGSEDEENNYYSIGGDNHNNLEEDKG